MSCADCCGLNNTYTYCTDCECLDCDFVFDGDECVDSMTGSCEKEAWKGDAWCDDGNNNAACDWDGGDCCGPSNKYSICTDCDCLDCTYEATGDDCVDSIVGSCGSVAYAGDGFCDDNVSRSLNHVWCWAWAQVGCLL